MGIVCSCFASVFMWTGELLENIFLAIGEIGSILIRGIFSFLVGLCDCLAAWSCCCQVPYAQRPDRTAYDFRSMGTNIGRGGVFASMSKEGRAARQQEKDAKKKEAEMKKEDAKVQKEEERKQKEKWATEKKQADEKAQKAAAEAKKAVKAKK